MDTTLRSAVDRRNPLRAAWAMLRAWLYRRTVPVISVLFLAIVIVTIGHVYFLQRDLVDSGARQGTQLQSEMLAALRPTTPRRSSSEYGSMVWKSRTTTATSRTPFLCQQRLRSV